MTTKLTISLVRTAVRPVVRHPALRRRSPRPRSLDKGVKLGGGLHPNRGLSGKSRFNTQSSLGRVGRLDDVKQSRSSAASASQLRRNASRSDLERRGYAAPGETWLGHGAFLPRWRFCDTHPTSR